MWDESIQRITQKTPLSGDHRDRLHCENHFQFFIT